MTSKVYDPDCGLTVLAEFEDPIGTKYYHLLDEKTQEISFATTAKGAAKSFKDFLMKHPYMTGMAVGVGISALDAYRSNKRLTTRFFAQNHIERKMYKDMANELVKTGKYTIIKDGKRIHNGWLWELKRRR